MKPGFRLLYIALISLYCATAVRAQQSVDEFLEIAATNNPGLKARFSDYLAAMESIPQAQGLPDPQLAFGIFIQPVETRVGPQRATLAVSQTFPWFGTLKAQGSAAAQSAEVRLQLFEDAKLRLFKNVRQAYDQLYLVERSITLTEENLTLLSSFKELARVNFESGKTPFVDVLRVEMEEQELKTQRDYWVDSRASSLAQFEALLNIELAAPIAFPDSLAVSPLLLGKQTLYDSIVANNASLASLRSELQAKEAQLRAVELSGKPSFTVGASYINIGDRTDVTDLAGNGQDAFLLPQVGLKLPIYRKKYNAQERAIALQQERLQYEIEDQTNTLTSVLESQIRDHLDASRRITLYNNLRELASQSLSLLQTEFSTGGADFEEVLRMERRLLGYQLELEKARVLANRAIYEINYLLGK